MKLSRLLPSALAVFTLHAISPCLVNAEEMDATWRGQSITDFASDSDERLEWQIVNDGVMGGLSEGNIEFTDSDTMKFFGELSLKNNGGFTTARSEEVKLNLSNDLGLLLRVKGDGRTYQARLDSDARYRGATVSFGGDFTTKKGEWQQIKIPFSDFKGSFRGTDLPDEILNPAAIERIWILLGDKKEGPFSLEIDWIQTYGKGQGNYTEAKSGNDGESVPSKSKVAAGKKKAPANLIDTAVADGRFTILKTALDRAGLTPFFQWDNKLTVFAPTDEAFKKLPEGTLDNLLKPENKNQLIALLSYHVSPGEFQLPQLLSAQEVEPVKGGALKVKFVDGRVQINDASLVDAGVACSDGVIHVIDSVLLPPQPQRKTVISTADAAGSFSTLLAAIDAAELREILVGDGPFTVLAPTDEAFSRLPEGVVETLLKDENRQDLVALLKGHVVSGRVTAGDALNASTAETLEGNTVTFAVDSGILKVNGATIQTINVEAGNGIIHIIDTVLQPAGDS